MALHTGRIADTFHLGDGAKKKEEAQELQPAPPAPIARPTVGGRPAKTHADGVMSRQRLADAAILINNGLIFVDACEGEAYWHEVLHRLRSKVAATKP